MSTIMAFADKVPTLLPEFPDDDYDRYERVIVSVQTSEGVLHTHYVPATVGGNKVGWKVNHTALMSGRTL